MSGYSEDHLVEQPAVQLMQHELGWQVVDCYDEWSGGVSTGFDAPSCSTLYLDKPMRGHRHDPTSV